MAEPKVICEEAILNPCHYQPILDYAIFKIPYTLPSPCNIEMWLIFIVLVSKNLLIINSNNVSVQG